MEVLLTCLTGIFFGCINVLFFGLGYYVRSKKPEDNVLNVNDENKDAVREIADWINFTGRRR